MEGDPVPIFNVRVHNQFQSAPSAWRATAGLLAQQGVGPVSIRALRVEGDTCCRRTCRNPSAFQSAPSAWRATRNPRSGFRPRPGFNPRPPRGGRRQLAHQLADGIIVSIRALRVEGDRLTASCRGSIRSFNPRPPRGGRRHHPEPEHEAVRVSIRALRVEGDLHFRADGIVEAEFQSAPSAWRATGRARASRQQMEVSIRALRVEGDLLRQSLVRTHVSFNPRPPRGGRRIANAIRFAATTFQSAPTAWRATNGHWLESHHALVSIRALRVEGDETHMDIATLTIVSIRALRVEGDSMATRASAYPRTFQSAPSAWRATNATDTVTLENGGFNPRPPRGGRLPDIPTIFQHLTSFNPRPPRGGRLSPTSRPSTPSGCFNPRPPRGGRRMSAL